MLLDRDEMQPFAARRVLAPGLPGCQERQSEAESRFEDREAAPPAPALRQPVAFEEHVTRLRESARGAVIDVAVLLGIRRAVRGEGEPGGREGGGHSASISA